MVRVVSIIAALVAVTPLIASESVRVHVSPRDVEAIRATVRAATRESVLWIDPIFVPQSGPGAIPVTRLVSHPRSDGDVRFKRVTLYERTDQVSVLTGALSAGSGGSYVLQKRGSRWKIIKRGLWME